MTRRHEFMGREVDAGRVKPEWIDINQHMNVAYYVLAFDLAVDTLWSKFGLTSEYVRETDSSTFAVESHVVYRREMKLDDPYVITALILAYDEKRIHQFQWMYHADEGYLAATAEWMNLHVDLGTRRVSPWPSRILENIAEVAAAQGEHEWPDAAGRRMQIPRPIYSMTSPP